MRAVLYCRVSSKEQTKNLSLPMQEASCREFCERREWQVERAFIERGESAKTADRTELQRMLTFCRRNRKRVGVVVVYNLNRFARNAGDHHAVRGILRALGITLRSVTENIDDSPGGKMVEGILATVHQFENDLRSERTRAGMREAAERGRWCWAGAARLRQPPLPRDRRQEHRAGPGAGAPGAPGLRGGRGRCLLRPGGARPGERARPDDPARQAGLSADVGPGATQPDLLRPHPASVVGPRLRRQLRAADLGGDLPARAAGARRPLAARSAPTSGTVPTSRCVASAGAVSAARR